MPFPPPLDFYELLLPLSNAKFRTATRPLPLANTFSSDAIVGTRIIDIINASWTIGIEHCLTPVAKEITPIWPPCAFHTGHTLPIVQHIKQSPAIFIWFPAGLLVRFRLLKARYAVVFRVYSSPQFHSVDLAYMFLHFYEVWTRDPGYHRFKIIYLTYRFVTDGSFGVMFFDDAFRFAFDHSKSSQSTISSSGPVDFGAPISFWNVDHTDDRLSFVALMHLLSLARALAHS